MWRPLLSIRNESDYDLAIERLNVLIDEVGDNEEHPLYELLDKLGEAVYAYEGKHSSNEVRDYVKLIEPED